MASSFKNILIGTAGLPATCTITSDETEFTDATPFEIQITFDKVRTGFVVGDITITNASLSGFAGSGTSYTADVTPDLTGDIEIKVLADVTIEGNSASNVVDVTYYNYVAKVLDTSPDAYWVLDEHTGATELSDSSGNGNHLDVYDTLVFEQTAITNDAALTSINFNNGHAILNKTKADALAVENTDISVMFWCRLDSLTSSQGAIVFAGDTVGDPESKNFQLSLQVNDTSGSLTSFWEYGSGTNSTSSSTSNLSIDTDYCIIITKNSTTKEVKFYINGTLDVTESYTDDPTGGSLAYFYVGNRIDGLRPFDNLSNIAVWKSVINASTAADLSIS